MNNNSKYVATYVVLDSGTGDIITGKKVLNSSAPIHATRMLQSEVVSELTCELENATFLSVSLVLKQGE